MKLLTTYAFAIAVLAGCAAAPPAPARPAPSPPLAATRDEFAAPSSEEPAGDSGGTKSAPAPNPYAAFVDQKEHPTGTLGECVTGLVEAINANDSALGRVFGSSCLSPKFLEQIPLDEHVGFFLQVYAGSHGFDFYGMRHFTDAPPGHEHGAILENRLTGEWLVAAISLEPGDGKIASLRFMPIRPPQGAPKSELSNLSSEQIVSQLRAFMRKLDRAGAFSGAVLLAKDGKILFKGAYGLASRRFGVPNKVDTKFNLGSMNKMFTAVVVTQLVAEDKLSFDARLSEFLGEDWLPRSVSEKIQVKHLLSHTSGLGSYFNDVFMESSRARFREIDDYKILVTEEELPFVPGTQFRYSNTGMLLAGAVIEKVTGQNYFDVVRERIYGPAGMNNSDSYEMDRPVPNLAIGYEIDANGWRNNLYLHVVRGGPAGGGFSTVEDLLAFDVALRGHKLLAPEYTELVLSPKPELGAACCGFGFSVEKTERDVIVGHSGGFSGIRANLDMFWDSGFTVAILENQSGAYLGVLAKTRELIAARK